MIFNTLVLVLAVCGAAFGQGFSQRRRVPQILPRFSPVPGQQSFLSPPPRSAFAPRPFVPILRSASDGPRHDGSYSFDYLSQNGIRREETGRRVAPNVLEVSGSYSYTSPDGTPVQVSYIADEFGYRAQSPTGHIPAVPQHSVDQIRAAEQLFARQGLRYVSGLI